MTYLLNATTQQIGECIGAGVCTTGSATYITDPRINVDSLLFYDVSAIGKATQQPQVVMVIHGTLSDTTRTNVSFSIQTTATQRTINI